MNTTSKKKQTYYLVKWNIILLNINFCNTMKTEFHFNFKLFKFLNTL